MTDLASARESLSGPLARGPAERDIEPPASETPPTSPEPAAPAKPPQAEPVARETHAPDPAAPGETAPASAETGHGRAHFLSLRPDPANDPAPRRLRTDAPAPPPAVIEYSPSRSARRPHASIPIKAGRESGNASKPSSAPTRAHATIPADARTARAALAEAQAENPPPAKPGGGIIGKIKRFFGIGGAQSGPLLAPHRGESQYEKKQVVRTQNHHAQPARADGGDSGHGPSRRRRRGGRRHRARREGQARAAGPE